MLARRDLGPDHLLVIDGHVGGVIDWTDAGWTTGDRSCLDSPRHAPFRDGLVRTYDPSLEDLRRSLDWHRLGPWHEVLWGLDEGGPAHVRSGLEGIGRSLAT